MHVCTECFKYYMSMNHGPRTQAVALKFIIDKVEYYEKLYRDTDLEHTPHPLTPILEQCKREKVPDVGVSTLREWYDEYCLWGELPYFARKRKIEMNRKAGMYNDGRALNSNQLRLLDIIIKANPNLFLDEIADEFGKETGIYLNHSTLHDILTRDLNVCLKVLSEVARQRCIEEEHQFLTRIAAFIQMKPEMLCCVDETARDENAARRRRGWIGKHEIAEHTSWYKCCIRYCMLAAADINGFITRACKVVPRENVASDQGASGTVDGDYFLWWVINCLCPELGDYSKGEPRSVVMLDNAATHMQDEVRHAIASVGAVCVFGAPYSPHLNPIEQYFSIYKAYLRRNYKRMADKHDWRNVHNEALMQVDRNKGIKCFRHAKVPGSDTMYTNEETEEIIAQALVLSTVV